MCSQSFPEVGFAVLGSRTKHDANASSPFRDSLRTATSVNLRPFGMSDYSFVTNLGRPHSVQMLKRTDRQRSLSAPSLGRQWLDPGPRHTNQQPHKAKNKRNIMLAKSLAKLICPLVRREHGEARGSDMS